VLLILTGLPFLLPSSVTGGQLFYSINHVGGNKTFQFIHIKKTYPVYLSQMVLIISFCFIKNMLLKLMLISHWFRSFWLLPALCKLQISNAWKMCFVCALEDMKFLRSFIFFHASRA
jgi:hypothetical protein